jgi:hypothetical protein
MGVKLGKMDVVESFVKSGGGTGGREFSTAKPVVAAESPRRVEPR